MTQETCPHDGDRLSCPPCQAGTDLPTPPRPSRSAFFVARYRGKVCAASDCTGRIEPGDEVAYVLDTDGRLLMHDGCAERHTDG